MKIFEFWKSCFFALLLHPTEAKVLLQSNKGNYYLPYVEINKRILLDDFKSVKDAIEQRLNISVNILHYASYQVNKKQRKIQGIYVLEQHNSAEEIQIGTWFDLSTLKSLSFDVPEHKSIIEKYLIELASGNSPKLRPPWAQPGWFSEASEWIEEQLVKLEYKQIAPVEYIRNWSLSSVLKVKTTGGNLYLKQASTCLPLFCDEPIVTAKLASLFPEHMPTVISIDCQHQWMLLADFGKPIGNNVSLKIKQDIYSLFAQIQIRAIQQRNYLLDVGCLDRRLEILQSQIEPLVNDKNALSELSAAEIEQLHTLAPYLKNLCSQLAIYKIPETLVHGDLHLRNVARYRNNYLFFDWTDSCISHPFFDLFELFIESKQKSFLGRLNSLWQQKSKNRLRDQYLNQWSEYESKERLLEAWNIAKPLAMLHHAITYQNMIHNLEARTKQEVNRALPYLLREIIRLC